MRACRRAMTNAEREEALLFVHDEALMALAQWAADGGMTGKGGQADTVGLWNNVRFSLDALLKLDERELNRMAKTESDPSITDDGRPEVSLYHSAPPDLDDADNAE
jgi:hypothetical protein